MTNNSSGTNVDNELTFSNRDYLDWDQKKQDMILNLGLANSNSETDQTPTPTRLIRNCEEVGLFQDLQIANPFDEVFKKAVENGSSTSLQVPVSSSDDTLHTPQIDPQLEETSKFQSKTAFVTNITSFSNVISNIDQRDDGDNPLVIALDQDKDIDGTCDGESNTIKDARQEIKAAIIKKSSRVVPVSIDKLIDPVKQKSKNDQLFQLKIREMLRQREANKASQSRCRKRKQKEFENMKAENKRLKDENSKLKAVNVYLEEAVKKLQKELREARSPNDEVAAENQSSTQVVLIKKKPLCNQKSQVVSLPISKAIASSSENTVQHPILTPLILNKPVNINNTSPKTSLKPLPIAPKPLVSNNNNSTIGIPLVVVYPKASLLPVKPLHILNDAEDSNCKKKVRK